MKVADGFQRRQVCGYLHNKHRDATLLWVFHSQPEAGLNTLK